ncbi:MAG: hypothetical protein ACFFBP_01540 [Promethearchaeota archaeon]
MNWITFFIIIGGFVFFVILIYYIYKFVRKSKKKITISSFKCIDGHVVKSKGELIIDNYLHINGIKHVYEKIIKVNGHPIKCDWYLPEIKLYIEYWGFFGKEYEERKKEKIKLYKKGRLHLLSIENHMFNDIYQNLRENLKDFIDFKEPSNQLKYCPNCGVNLDDRFIEKSNSINI